MVDIDLVCCWVELNEEYQRSLTKHSFNATRKQTNKARFRQLGELNYSIPMALRNLPWIRKVFIVTNGQDIPNDLKKMDKVEVVHHSSIFRDQTLLPTFSYHAIQPHLCFIKGLAEHFIVTNDDIFINKPMSQAEFLGGTGNGKFLHTRKVMSSITEPDNIWQHNLKNSEKAMKRVFGERERMVFPHMPQLFRKSYCVKTWELFEEELLHTISNKFRAESNVIFRSIYPYVVAYSEYGVRDFRELIKLSSHDFDFVNNKKFKHISLGRPGKGNWEDNLSSFDDDAVELICLNDDIPEQFYDDTKAIVQKKLRTLMEK